MSVRSAAIWALASQYTAFAIQFIASVVISRFFLLPSDVGLFSIALATAMVVSIFQDMGITRFVSGQPDMEPRALPHYAAVAVAISWLVAAVIAAAAPFVADFYEEPGLAALLWLIAASYLITPFATVPAALLVRAMDFRSLFRINAGSAFAGNVVAVACAARGLGAMSLAWGVLATALIRAAIALAAQPVWPKRPPTFASVGPMLGFGSASFAISVSAAIGHRSQDLIVGRLLGVVSTGLFSRASALAGQLSTLVTGAISTVFYPAFARKRDAGEPLAAPYLHLVACNTVLNWAAMVGLALAAEPVVLLLYGENWAKAASLVCWMAIGEMLFVAIPLQMDIPILLGRIRTLIWVNLLETCAALAILTTGCLFGLEAAAFSRIAYGLVWWAIYATYQSRLLDFRMSALLAIYARSGICALAAGIPMIVAAQFGWKGAALGLPGLLLLSGLGVVTWFLAILITRHPAVGEIRLAIAAPLRMLSARAAH